MRINPFCATHPPLHFHKGNPMYANQLYGNPLCGDQSSPGTSLTIEEYRKTLQDYGASFEICQITYKLKDKVFGGYLKDERMRMLSPYGGYDETLSAMIACGKDHPGINGTVTRIDRIRITLIDGQNVVSASIVESVNYDE